MNHIGDTNKMVSETPISDSTPHNVAELGMLCRRLERLAAVRLDYIQRLEAELDRLTAKVAQLYEGAEDAKKRIQSLISERDTARLQSDQQVSLREEFRELLGTDDIEQGVAVVREMKNRIKRLEEAGDALSKTQTYDLLENVNWRKAKEDKL